MSAGNLPTAAVDPWLSFRGESTVLPGNDIPGTPTVVTAKDQIEQLLHSNPERIWSCGEMARHLKMTVRTIAREVGALCLEDKASKVYGRQRRLTFKAKPAVDLPHWLKPRLPDNLDAIPTLGVIRHTIGDD